MNKKATSWPLKIIVGFVVLLILMAVMYVLINIIFKAGNIPFLTGECDCKAGTGCDTVTCEKCGENCQMQGERCVCPTPTT